MSRSVVTAPDSHCVIRCIAQEPAVTLIICRPGLARPGDSVLPDFLFGKAVLQRMRHQICGALLHDPVGHRLLCEEDIALRIENPRIIDRVLIDALIGQRCIGRGHLLVRHALEKTAQCDAVVHIRLPLPLGIGLTFYKCRNTHITQIFIACLRIYLFHHLDRSHRRRVPDRLPHRDQPLVLIGFGLRHFLCRPGNQGSCIVHHAAQRQARGV